MFRNTLARASAFSRIAFNQQSRNLACSTIYVRNLPVGISEEKLRSYVEKFGPIYEIHIPKPNNADMAGIAFVKLYTGEIPSTIEEVAQLPDPSAQEINELNERCAEAISYLNSVQIDGSSIGAAIARKNQLDTIQFNARFALRKARDPEFASMHESRRQAARGPNTTSKDYRAGYADGFKDGVASANSN
ncbi:hypothetical protein GGF40_004208 [Coemansia sp. RSA 1286]|nr:hypothetical protein GGF40_004208 [Coemansia sp. RSA 1286]